MNKEQVEHIEDQLDAAISSKDPVQIMTACAMCLKTTAKCTAHTGERTKEMIIKLDDLLQLKSKVNDLEERLKKLEEKEKIREIQQIERRGAGKMLGILSKLGLLAGGALAAKLPAIWDAIQAFFQ